MTDGISPANLSKLLNLLTDPMKCKMLKIELAAYVEGMKPLRELCYFLECDGTDMAFVVAKKINAFKSIYENGSVKITPSTSEGEIV